MKQDVRAYIWSGMAERDWTPNELARRMASETTSARVQGVALDFLFSLDDPRLTLGHEMAEDLGRAFGTDAQFWLTLEQMPAEEAQP